MNQISIVVGINSVINSLLGGHPAIVARTGVAILAGPDAGPESQRYWANLVAAPLTMIIALAAGLVIPILAVLPASYESPWRGWLYLPLSKMPSKKRSVAPYASGRWWRLP